MKEYRSTSGIIISYDEKNTIKILNSISALKKEIKQSGSFWVGFGISFSLHNLANLLIIQKFEDEYLLRQLIFKGIISNPNISEAEVEPFLDIVGKEIQKFNSRTTQEFQIIYPINFISEEFSIDTEITLNNISIKVLSWEYVRNNYQMGTLLQEIEKTGKQRFKLDYLINMTTPFSAHIFDRTYESAFRRVERSVETLRSVLNFYQSDMVNIHLGIPEPLAKIRRVGLYGVFSPAGELVAPYFDQTNLTLNDNKKFNENIY